MSRATAEPDARRSWGATLRANRVDVLLVALVLVVSAPVVELLMAHQASRLALTGAIVDRTTIVIDAYSDILSVDFAERDGRLYSDKAPGQPLLAAPFYAQARVVGAEPAEVERYFDNLTLWWTTLWSATVPLALLAVLMRRHALRVTGDRRAATAAAVGMSLSTLLLPFGTVLFSHVLAGMLAFAAYLLARDPRTSPAAMLGAGLLAGLAVLTEYTTGIVVVVIGVLLALRRSPLLANYIIGGVPAVVALAAYNTAAWGSPTEFSYANSGAFADFHAQGLFGIRLPSPSLTAQVLVGERGLLTMTPIVLLGVVGLVLLARERRNREAGIVGLVVLAAFVCVQGGWFSVTAGASPGPRYVVAALPFVAVGVARAWRWSAPAVVAAGLVGAVAMLAAIFTNPLAQPTESFAVGHWIWRMLNDRWGMTLLTPYVGAPLGQLIQAAVALPLLALLWRATTAPGPSGLVEPDAEVSGDG